MNATPPNRCGRDMTPSQLSTSTRMRLAAVHCQKERPVTFAYARRAIGLSPLESESEPPPERDFAPREAHKHESAGRSGPEAGSVHR